MHGEPSWSYLYRRMIPLLTEAGLRVVAPDLVGFGRSDKPTEQSDYTYERHVAWMQEAVIDGLDFTDATFFGQDWGGLIGLRLVAENPERFARVVIGNTGLPTGHGTPTAAFLEWQRFSQTVDEFNVGFLVSYGTTRDLSEAEIAAYNAPFPDDSYKAGARIFPTLVPTSLDDPASPANQAAWAVFDQWEKQFITCFSDGDPITGGGDRLFRERIPGARGQPHVTTSGGHFFQEDSPEHLAAIIIDAVNG
jgi:haloalkane dehalogenase